jgi:hypothetical protein
MLGGEQVSLALVRHPYLCSKWSLIPSHVFEQGANMPGVPGQPLKTKNKIKLVDEEDRDWFVWYQYHIQDGRRCFFLTGGWQDMLAGIGIGIGTPLLCL